MRGILPWAFAVLVCAAAPAGATMLLRRLSVDDLAVKAERIVHGTIVGVRAGRDAAGLPVTWTTIDVARDLKGPRVHRLTIKQLGVSQPVGNSVLRIPGMPQYTVGEELVLFLHGESTRGFSSPVGMGQGVYRVTRDAAGATISRGRSTTDARNLDVFLADIARRVQASR